VPVKSLPMAIFLRTSLSGDASRATARRRGVFAALTALTLPIIAGSCEEPKPPPPVRPERSHVSLIHDKAGEARISGLEPIRGFAAGRDCTFIHCLELVLDAVDRPVSYDELMGLSGMAFRLQFRIDRWDVGAPDPLVGENRLPVLFAAIGWEYEVRVVGREQLTEGDALRQAIRQSIDRRLPVLAANIIPPEDWGIITGYRRDQTWLCRAYNDGAEGVDQPAKGWPTAVVLLIGRTHGALTPREAHADSVRHAVELFIKQHTEDYAVGDAAFDEWCRALAAVRDHKYVHPNFWTYIGLIDARGAAARYLRSIEKEPGVREVQIKAAADWYDKEVRVLLKGLESVPPEQKFPDSLPPVELRNRQIDVLREAQGLERNAIDVLRKAM
jgi:hypothetical protein